jgi:hypothetical protein
MLQTVLPTVSVRGPATAVAVTVFSVIPLTVASQAGITKPVARTRT